MAMTRRNNAKDFGYILGTIEEFVPENHLVRKLEETIDWCFIYPLVSSLYSSIGRPSMDPVILFKMIFINYCFGINSIRKEFNSANSSSISGMVCRLYAF